ncbi:MAG: radical SAM protein, partial [Candidatus Sumerlaeia bacterium]|nr:radical SAM protein [Candidatus Sumerlaeia bacterium]
MNNNFTEIKCALSPATNPVINDFLALLDSCCLQPLALARPSHYSVSVSVVCDNKCPYCARQTYTELVESGLMKLEQFKQLGDDLRFAQLVALYGLGEPLLHPQFFEFVRLVKSAGGYASTSSHGMTLTPEVIGKILDSGLDELEISIDAIDEKLFNYLRRGAHLPTIIKNVESLQREKQRRGIKLPKVQIACAISVYNLKEIPKIVRLASQL